MQTKKESVKEKILETALSLFCKQGFENTSMADIARGAGISTGNIYRYLKDKEALFAEILPKEFIQSIENELSNLMVLASQEQDFSKKDTNASEYWRQLDNLLTFIYQNRERILILLKHRPASPDIPFREKIEKQLVRKAIGYLRDVHRYSSAIPQKERQILHLIYRSFIESSYQILQGSLSEDSFRERLQLLRAYHLPGLHSYFCQISLTQKEQP